MSPQPRKKSPFADDVEPSTRVIGAVADELGVDPLECPPLYEHVDPTALNRLFDGRPTTDGQITLEYAGYSVIVDSKGDIELTDNDD